ncbi:MAG: protein-L-isoaspartate(D-aspartate) O-methyltransferase [Gemmatimonadales bacterium]
MSERIARPARGSMRSPLVSAPIRSGILLLALLGGETIPMAAQSPDRAAIERAREAMVTVLARRGVRDSATLRALRTVPRHEFVELADPLQAYADRPHAIGHGATISQPFVVGRMTELLHPRPGLRVLEVGTGSGYQAAVLAEIGCEVFTIELVEPLATLARSRLDRLGYAAVRSRQGDGYLGWPEAAPFDAIVVTAAAPEVPPALVAQLRPGGRMVIPTGPTDGVQHLLAITKDARGRVRTRRLEPVRFVPLIPADTGATGRQSMPNRR